MPGDFSHRNINTLDDKRQIHAINQSSDAKLETNFQKKWQGDFALLFHQEYRTWVHFPFSDLPIQFRTSWTFSVKFMLTLKCKVCPKPFNFSVIKYEIVWIVSRERLDKERHWGIHDLIGIRKILPCITHPSIEAQKGKTAEPMRYPITSLVTKSQKLIKLPSLFFPEHLSKSETIQCETKWDRHYHNFFHENITEKTHFSHAKCFELTHLRS